MTDVDPRQPRPAVSVVIPNHNAAAFLPRGIRSALDQIDSDVEVIVVDDCSSEDPAPALAQFGDRVRLIRLTVNSGPSVARNTGAAAASGSILTFLDADDWWPTDFLAQIVPRVNAGNAVCYDNHRVAEGDLARPIPPVDPADSLLHDWFLTGPKTVGRDNLQTLLTIPNLFKLLVHRDDFAKAGGFDSRYRGEEDLHFCIKLAAAGVRLEIAERPKGFYLVRQGSILRSIQADVEKNLASLRSWWEMFRDLPLENDLPTDAIAECRRLCQYYRARFTDASIKSRMRGGRVLSLFDPSFMMTVVPAVPGMIALKVRGLTRRVRAISQPVLVRRNPTDGQTSDSKS